MAKNPCIGVCKFNKKTGLCIGCLRTRDEKRDWKRAGRGGPSRGGAADPRAHGDTAGALRLR